MWMLIIIWQLPQQLQRLEEAEKFYRKVINLKPSHIEAFFT